MKKIITAKEQWTNDVNASYNKYGEFDNISYHKIQNDHIGIINDNEMYHFDQGDDVFYIKSGENYRKVVCQASSEVLVQNNWRKFDLSETWFDTGALMEWLFLTDSNGDKDYPCVESILGLLMYELIWMHIYGSECTETTYQDIEVEVEDIPEVKQTFLQDAEQNAHYVDEVAGIAYWYNESLDAATLYIGDDTNKDYRYAVLEPFCHMSKEEYKKFLDYVAITFDEKSEEFMSSTMHYWMTGEELSDYKYLSYYCDFLMQGGRTPYSTNKFESPKSKQNVQASKYLYLDEIDKLKSRLITDITRDFKALNTDKFFIIRDANHEYVCDINVIDNDMWLAYNTNKTDVLIYFSCWDGEADGFSLTYLTVDDLYNIYSQLHK